MDRQTNGQGRARRKQLDICLNGGGWKTEGERAHLCVCCMNGWLNLWMDAGIERRYIKWTHSYS